MKRIILLLIITVISFSCDHNSTDNSTKTIKSEALGKNGLIIDYEIITDIENELNIESKPFHREVWKYTWETEENYILDTGVCFNFISESVANSIFNNYHKAVEKSGNYLFLTNMDFDESYNTYYDIVIINCANQFDLISLIGTHGGNYDIYSDSIIAQMKTWDKEVGFSIDVVDVSRIHAKMDRLPDDLEKFTNEIYEFCPDVIDQGYGDMDDMISDYQAHKYFWLWWD